ncbi:MAG TPA: glutathione S-transferase family protein [Caulobacterales bacterium]|nr:glutathione S-transferase family protein [Caulobacterales bacterium]
MSIKLHVFPHSPRAFKVLAVAHQLGLDYELKFCDLLKGGAKTPEFTALNPNQKMPVIEDAGLKLWESNAICCYLAAQKPEGGLVPEDMNAHALMLQWMFWESTTWDPACAILAFENAIKPLLGIGAPDPAEVEKGETKVRAAAAILDAHLANRAYMLGDRLSLADFSLGADLIIEDMARLPLAPFANIRRWRATLAQLPGWKAALAMRPDIAAAA